MQDWTCERENNSGDGSIRANQIASQKHWWYGIAWNGHVMKYIFHFDECFSAWDIVAIVTSHQFQIEVKTLCDAAIFDAISSLGNNSPFSVITKSKFDFTFCGAENERTRGPGQEVKGDGWRGLFVCSCGWLVYFLDLLLNEYTEWVRYYEYEINSIWQRIFSKSIRSNSFGT